MRRHLLLFFFFIIAAQIANAQSQGNISMKIIDSKDNSAVVGAVINIEADKDHSYYNTTDSEGSVKLSGLNYGEYKLTATFLGYDTIKRNIVLNQQDLNLGTLKITEQVQKIDRVTIQAAAIRTSQSGDTIIYNADSYKVTADAVAEGLLAKMPGIKVEDGEVETQGEQVQKILLDGKEFFGDDVALAVKNIPADIIDKVEVFSKLSDNAEFTGFDDGDSYMAINFVTKTGRNTGQFGKFTVGYAHENLYQASANYNYFTNDHRVSIIAGYNNMNIRNFGSMDLVGSSGKGNRGNFSRGGGTGSGSGLATVGAIGFNYGGEFAESKLKLDLSYFYNMTDSESSSTTDRVYMTDEEDGTQRYYYGTSSSASDNMNHRVNAKVTYKPNDRHSIMIRPEFAFQDNGSSSYSFKDNDVYDGTTMTDLYETTSSKVNDKDAYSMSNNLVYRALIGNGGRNIMINASASYSSNNSHALSDTETSYIYSPEADTAVIQNILNGTESYNISGGFTYSEPIFEKSTMLTMKYNFRYRYSDADYKVYQWEEELNAYNPDYDLESSNIYNSGYLTHSVGPGIMYTKAKLTTLTANVYYQLASLMNTQDVPVITPATQKYSFDDIVYSMMLRKSFNQTNSMRVMLRSSTDNPSVSELQDVVKDSDPSSVSSGNSSLEPSYSHSLRATYTRSNIMKGRTFMVMVNGSLTNNYIGDSTVMLLTSADSFTLPNGNELESYGEFTKPVNLNGAWNISTSVSYGTPIYPLYCNLNSDLGFTYRESPSIFNGIENLSMSSSYKAGLSLGSNISEYVDFTLSYNGSYNIAKYKYDLSTSTNDNEYMTHKASASFKFVFWAGITLSGNTSYTQYKGITDDFNQEYISCNIYLGKKLFKNQRGEISVGVNDLFNQTEKFSRNITETYVENVTTTSIGRYYGIKFVYDLRKFNGNSPSNMRGEGGGRSRGEGGGRGGDMF